MRVYTKLLWSLLFALYLNFFVEQRIDTRETLANGKTHRYRAEHDAIVIIVKSKIGLQQYITPMRHSEHSRELYNAAMA